MRQAYIGLGSNVGKRLSNLHEASKRIDALKKTHIIQRSSVYETSPVGACDQSDFLNQVIGVKTALPVYDLWHELSVIEHLLGRKRTKPLAPRTIDCDLLLFGEIEVQTAELTVPHPRMHERFFVLVPMVEIAPDCLHPVLRLTMRELLERIPKGEVEKQRIKRYEDNPIH